MLHLSLYCLGAQCILECDTQKAVYQYKTVHYKLVQIWVGERVILVFTVFHKYIVIHKACTVTVC